MQKQIQQNLLNHFHPTFVKSYCGILNRIHNDGKSRDADLNVLETRLKTKALESTQKDTGLAYSTRYTKYLAARNQIVANANLDRGTIKVPLESWEALKSLDKESWITYEPYTKISKATFEEDYKNDKVQLYKKLQEEGIGALSAEERKWLENYRKIK